MKLSEKTPENFRRLAKEARKAGEHAIANEFERMAKEMEEGKPL